MKAIEFTTKVNNNIIQLPKHQEHLTEGKKVKVIVLIEDKEDDSTFQQLTQEQFLKGYGEEDSMYDGL